MTTPVTNPFPSPIRLLAFTAKDYLNPTNSGSDLPDIPLLSPGENNPNPYCRFIRMETSEEAMQIFPEGKILVYDTSDIVTILQVQGYNQIYVQFMNNEQYVWDIKSVSYLNNAVSEYNRDKRIVEISFTNKFYKLAQKDNISDRFSKFLKYPKVGKILPAVQLLMQDVITNIGASGPSINTFIASAEPENYVLCKPRTLNNHGFELKNDNFLNLVNYYFSFAYHNDKPHYLCWTDFSNSVNYKFFDIDHDLEQNYSTKLDDTSPYFIKTFMKYQTEVPFQEIDGVKKYRIHVLTATPAKRINYKNAYYERYTPKLLQSGVSGLTSLYQNMGSLFLPKEHQFTTEYFATFVTGSNGGLSASTGSVFYLDDYTPWGYPSANQNTTGKTKNALERSEMITRMPYDDDTDFWLRPFSDSSYIWQAQFDLTPLHPNLPTNANFDGEFLILDDCILNKILYCSRAPVTEDEGTDRLSVVEAEQEKLNILKYVLCCIGRTTPEPDWFFALITAYERMDSSYTNGPWYYYWVKIDPTVTNGVPSFDLEQYKNLYGNEYYNNRAINLNEIFNASTEFPDPDCYLRGRGLTFSATGTVGNTTYGTWSFTATGSPQYSWVPYTSASGGLNPSLYTTEHYLGPGYDARNITASPGFAYRPIGFLPLAASSGSEINEIPAQGVCRHLVKMYKYTDENGNFFYYFNPTNVVDGRCVSSS